MADPVNSSDKAIEAARKTLLGTLYLHQSLDFARKLVADFEAAVRAKAVADERRRIEPEFERLANQWMDATRYLSNLTQVHMQPAYQRIIGMGPAVLPFILRRLQTDRSGSWFWALACISGQDAASGIDTINEAVESWLTWGKAVMAAGSVPVATPEPECQGFVSHAYDCDCKNTNQPKWDPNYAPVADLAVIAAYCGETLIERCLSGLADWPEPCRIHQVGKSIPRWDYAEGGDC